MVGFLCSMIVKRFIKHKCFGTLYLKQTSGSLLNNWMIFGSHANSVQAESQAGFPSVCFALQILLHQAFF